LSAGIELFGSDRDVRSVQLAVPLPAHVAEKATVRFALPADWVGSYHYADGELRFFMAGASPMGDGAIARVLIPQEDLPQGFRLTGSARVNENGARPLEIRQ
jgi:hypothetical protein